MIRTMYRIFISKKNLLRWNTAEAVDASIVNTRRGYFITMWSSLLPAAALVIILFMGHLNPAGMILTAIVIADWCFASQIAYGISQPDKKLQLKNLAQNNELLLDTARRTWQFFLRSFPRRKITGSVRIITRFQWWKKSAIKHRRPIWDFSFWQSCQPGILVSKR